MRKFPEGASRGNQPGRNLGFSPLDPCQMSDLQTERRVLVLSYEVGEKSWKWQLELKQAAGPGLQLALPRPQPELQRRAHGAPLRPSPGGGGEGTSGGGQQRGDSGGPRTPGACSQGKEGHQRGVGVCAAAGLALAPACCVIPQAPFHAPDQSSSFSFFLSVLSSIPHTC